MNEETKKLYGEALHQAVEKLAENSVERCIEIIKAHLPWTAVKPVQDAIIQAYGEGLKDGGQGVIEILLTMKIQREQDSTEVRH